jgi:hypothetical protein
MSIEKNTSQRKNYCFTVSIVQQGVENKSAFYFLLFSPDFPRPIFVSFASSLIFSRSARGGQASL